MRLTGLVILLATTVLCAAGECKSQSQEAAPDLPQRIVRAEQALAELPGLDSSDVDIFDDNIVLTGKAIDSGVVTKASELVQSITGIETIDNRIELSYNISDRVRGAADRVGERAEQWLAYLPLLPIAAAIVAAGMLLSWLIGKWRWPFMHMVSNPFLRDITQKLTQIVCLVVSILFALEGMVEGRSAAARGAADREGEIPPGCGRECDSFLNN